MHRTIDAPGIPPAKGPYSAAVAFGQLLFVSGQGARHPITNALPGTDIASQTEQCLRNISAILEAAGSGLPHVLRCGVFLTDMSDFAGMNEVYGRAFGSHRPARTTVQVSALPTPDMRVEIDCIAYVP